MGSRTFLFIATVLTFLSGADAFAGYRIYPYVQNPSPKSITILWFSDTRNPGLLRYSEDGGTSIAVNSLPRQSKALSYTSWEAKTFLGGHPPAAPYRHQINLASLKADTVYHYTVVQDHHSFSSSFRTAPTSSRNIRFIVFADCETEPESSGARVKWDDPSEKSPDRKYLVDQTMGYANNLSVIRARTPDFVAIAGDIVESGGEQRDWDEFWKQNTSAIGSLSLASSIPIIPALGNHEYYAGPKQGEYNQPFSEAAVNKYLTYFDVPSNDVTNAAHRGRYYRFDYGPIALIVLDVTNSVPSESSSDTNFFLRGEGEDGGGHSPNFGPGSTQYVWLERQLAEAQRQKAFTFVMFHHSPYSLYHALPPGAGEGADKQSGIPVRVLTPLFERYGVDAVISGHGEIWTRVEQKGKEILPSGKEKTHTVQFYDVGIGGDGLRGPEIKPKDFKVAFSPHLDSQEVWKKGKLMDGGKHYGHLEVNVTEGREGTLQAELVPVYVFPFVDSKGNYSGFERRIWPDVVYLKSGL